MANRIKGITIEIGGDTTKLSKALEGINKDLKVTQNGLKDVDKLLKMDPGNVELLRQKQGYLNDAIDKTKEKIEQEKQALEQMKNSEGFDKNSEAAKALERQIAEDEQALKRLTAESREFGSVGAQQFKAVGAEVQKVGGQITDFGKGMSMSVTAPIVGVGTAAMVAFKDVDAGLDIVRQKTGATGDEFASMKGIVESIATTVPTDFQTIGNAVGETATRFQVTGDELETLSTAFLKFSEVNQTDVVNSIDTAQKALGAFGLDASEAEALLDTLNKTGQATGAGMDTLLNGLVQNGTAFQEMGLDIHQATVFMGQMETSGANSETVMNGLRKALKNSAKDGKDMNTALSELQDAILNGTDSMDGLTLAYDMFGKSGDQIYGAIKNGTLDFTALADAASISGTTVSEVFDEMKDPADEWTLVMNEAKIAGAELGNAIQTTLAPMIGKAAEVVGSLADKFKALSPEQKEMIVKIGLVVAAIGPAIMVIGSLVSAIGTVISVIGSAMGVITTVVSVLGGPFTLAIAAAVAIGVTLWKNWDTIKEKAAALWTSIKETFAKIRDAIVGPVEKARDAVKAAIDKIKGFFKFEWKLPKLKLPHIKISGEFSLVPPSVPSFSIDWYKKAYNDPVLFTSPTVLPTASGLKGFGDGAGAEVVMGLNKLKEMVGGGGNNEININVYGAQGQDVRQLASEVEQILVQTLRSNQAVFA